MRPIVEFTKDDNPEDGKIAVVIEDVCGFMEHGEKFVQGLTKRPGTIINLIGGLIVKVKEDYDTVKRKLTT